MRRPYNVRFVSIPRNVNPPSRRPFRSAHGAAGSERRGGAARRRGRRGDGPSAKNGRAPPIRARCGTPRVRPPVAGRAVNGRQGILPPAPAPSPVTPRTCDSRFSPEQGSLVRIPSEGTCIPDDPEAGCIPVIPAHVCASRRPCSGFPLAQECRPDGIVSYFGPLTSGVSCTNEIGIALSGEVDCHGNGSERRYGPRRAQVRRACADDPRGGHSRGPLSNPRPE